MMRTAEIILPKLPKSINSLFSMHWTKRSEYQKTWDVMIYAAWCRMDRQVFVNPVTVHYDLYFDTSRDRDYDNYYGGTKFPTDALKRTFLLRDDYHMLRSISVDFHQAAERKTKITISETQC